MNMKIWHKWERENKVRRKTRENKESHVFFFEVIFFWTETKGLRQKKQDIYQKRDWKQRKIAKCFWISCMKEQIQKQKLMKLKKNKSLKNDKKSINDIFWNFCPKTKRQFIFRDPKRRLIEENQEK